MYIYIYIKEIINNHKNKKKNEKKLRCSIIIFYFLEVQFPAKVVLSYLSCQQYC
jgi:hypothetical protein